MIALSIRQPWAWLILHAGKDIENRDWPTRYRGEFLIHAGVRMTADDYDSAARFVRGVFALPKPEDLPRGGIVGQARIVDCVTESPSRWFAGKYGFVLADPRPLALTKCKGRLGFFDPEQMMLIDKPLP